jgi:hypothetical protein
MGKTFRSNEYMHYHGSFNSLKNHKYAKIFTRRIQRRFNNKISYDETYDSQNFNDNKNFEDNIGHYENMNLNIKHIKHIKK